MDVRVGEGWAGTLPLRLLRRKVAERTAESDFHRGLARVLSVLRTARWEWVVAIVALFLLGRTPVLFVRERMAGVFGARAGHLWQEDLVLQIVFGVVMVAVLAIAIRRSDASALLRQPFLLAFCAFAWLSVAWSVEPQVTVRRSLLLLGTVVIGWFIGDRFAPHQQARLVASVALFGALVSVIVLPIWPSLTMYTNGDPNQWSGVYMNRNLFALVLSYGLLAMLFVAKPARRRALVWIAFVPMVVLLLLTGARTGPVALAATIGAIGWIYFLRRLGNGRMTAAGGAVFSLATLGSVGMLVHWYWLDILTALGREAGLTGRVAIWQVDRFFAAQQPWTGWGFEAIWTNKNAILRSMLATGRYPYSSHSGYYEILLGVGRLGLVLFVLFLATAAWRAFRHAWGRSDLLSLWPLAFIVFAVVVNFSESLFVSSEALLALTVATAVGVTEFTRREHLTPAP